MQPVASDILPKRELLPSSYREEKVKSTREKKIPINVRKKKPEEEKQTVEEPMMDMNLVITDFRHSFTSSDFDIPGSDLGFGGQGYCRKRTLRGGKQEGVEVIEISNGIISLRVCPTRGMGIIDGSFKSHHIGWHSPVEEIVHPQYIHLLEMGGRGCHYGFNEFLNRCGIEWSGAKGEEVIVDNMGNKNRIFLPHHGKVGWLPACRLVLHIEDERLTLEGDIHEQIIFGVNYLLRTCLTFNKDEPFISIKDTLFNLGDTEGEYEILYHTNFGPPFLEEGACFYGTYDRIVPRNEFAEKGLKDFGELPGPTPGFIEQVFFLRSKPDKNGFAHNLLVNSTKDLAADVRYRTGTLPYSAIWIRCAGVNEGYVIGFNQCSDLPNPRKIEREEERVTKLKAGENVTFEQDITFYAGEKEVTNVLELVQKNRGKAQIIPCADFKTFASNM